jgi:hypothetical protein
MHIPSTCHTEHANLLHQMLQGETVRDDIDLECLTDHMNQCEECRTAFALLATITTSVSIRALSLHILNPDQVPGDAELALFASIDPVQARIRYPEIASHISICSHCRERVGFATEMIADYKDGTIFYTMDSALTQSVQSTNETSLWQPVEQGINRLKVLYHIGVRRLATRLSSTYPSYGIAPSLSWKLGLLSFVPSVEQSRSQTCLIELRNDINPSLPWVNLALTWRAFRDKRLSFRLRARYAFPGVNEETSEPVSGISWHLISESSPESKPLCHGITNAIGEDAGYIDPDQFGSVKLIVEHEGISWHISLHVVDDVVAQTAQAHELLIDNHIDEALTAFNAAIDIDRTYAPSYIGRGDTLVKMGQLDDALKDYEHAIGLNPDDVLAYIGQGRVFTSMGKHTEAIKAYEQSLQLMGVNTHPALWAQVQQALQQLRNNT